MDALVTLVTLVSVCSWNERNNDLRQLRAEG